MHGLTFKLSASHWTSDFDFDFATLPLSYTHMSNKEWMHHANILPLDVETCWSKIQKDPLALRMVKINFIPNKTLGTCSLSYKYLVKTSTIKINKIFIFYFWPHPLGKNSICTNIKYLWLIYLFCSSSMWKCKSLKLFSTLTA